MAGTICSQKTSETARQERRRLRCRSRHVLATPYKGPDSGSAYSIIAAFWFRGVERGEFSVVKDAQIGSGTVIRGHCDIFGSDRQRTAR